MTVNIFSIPILVNRIRMSGCLHIPSVLVDGYHIIDTLVIICTSCLKTYVCLRRWIA